MKLNINGTVYEYDLDHISVRDAMMLKTATGMNLRPFSQAIGDLDAEALVALAWLVLTRAGVKGADGQPLTLADVPDFDMLQFLQEEEPSEPEEDPTTGELNSGNGATPDSTSPAQSTTTP